MFSLSFACHLCKSPWTIKSLNDRLKELSLCHKLKFANSDIFAT